MKKNIFVIVAIALFFGLILIPATTAKISWIRGPFIGGGGAVKDAEEPTWDGNPLKIGNNYIYKNVHIVGTVYDGPPRCTSLYIGGWLFPTEIPVDQRISIDAKFLINIGPLQIVNNNQGVPNEIVIHGTGDITYTYI